MIDVRIAGQDELRRLAAHIRSTGDKGLGKQFAKALEKAVEPVKAEIVAEAERTMPSGYRETLTRSLKHRRTTRAGAREATVRLATHGEGKVERRDLPSLNKGALRHPLFARRKKWYVTKIAAGFHDRAIKAAGPAAEKAILAILDDFTDRLAKG